MKKIIVGLLGVVISIVVALVWANGGLSQGRLLQLGKVYEFGQDMLMQGNASCMYDMEQNHFLVQSDSADLYFKVASGQKDWKYYVLDVKDIGSLPMFWHVQFLGRKDKVLQEFDVAVRPGRNYLDIRPRGRVNTIRIVMSAKLGNTFRIEKMQLRQKYFDAEDFGKKILTVFLWYVVLVLLVSAGKGLDWYIFIDILQTFYLWTGNAWGSRMAAGMSRKRRARLQTFCFFLMYLMMIGMDVVSGRDYFPGGRYWVFGFGILLLFAGILTWEVPLQKQNWRSGICLGWLFLWGMTVLSDLFVKKSFSYVGWIMLLCGGSAFFIWHNQEAYAKVRHSARRGLEWTLVPILLFCMVFRQKKPGIGYPGCFRQRESMALYGLALLLVFLAEMYLHFGKKKLQWGSIVISGAGAAVSSSLVYYTQEWKYLLVAGLLVLIWGIMLGKHHHQRMKKWKELMAAGLFTLACAWCAVILVKYAVEVLPQALGTDVAYENEIPAIGPWEEDGEAYIQQLNLLGHKDNLRTEGIYRMPYNGIIQIAHRYGMFVLVPYLALLLMCIYSAIRERRFFWRALMAAFLVALVMGNPELPFTNPLWLLFYMEIGRMLPDQEKEKNF